MTTRRLGMLILTVAGLGLGAIAVASGGTPSNPPITRPTAANPCAESPTPAFLALQKQALPQPSGERADGAISKVPTIVSPQR